MLPTVNKPHSDTVLNASDFDGMAEDELNQLQGQVKQAKPDAINASVAFHSEQFVGNVFRRLAISRLLYRQNKLCHGVGF